jgi:hypothetical protein
MERILVLSFLFACANAFAATPGNAPILTIAAPGQNTQALSVPLSSLSGTGINGVFTLFAGFAFTSNTACYPFYKNGVQYQVTTGKVAYCFNIRAGSGNTNGGMTLMSGTATFSPGATCSGITGVVYQTGTNIPGANVFGSIANTYYVIPGSYDFSSSTFPGVIANGTGASFFGSMDCYEQ